MIACVKSRNQYGCVGVRTIYILKRLGESARKGVFKLLERFKKKIKKNQVLKTRRLYLGTTER